MATALSLPLRSVMPDARPADLTAQGKAYAIAGQNLGRAVGTIGEAAGQWSHILGEWQARRDDLAIAKAKADFDTYADSESTRIQSSPDLDKLDENGKSGWETSGTSFDASLSKKRDELSKGLSPNAKFYWQSWTAGAIADHRNRFNHNMVDTEQKIRGADVENKVAQMARNSVDFVDVNKFLMDTQEHGRRSIDWVPQAKQNELIEFAKEHFIRGWIDRDPEKAIALLDKDKDAFLSSPGKWEALRHQAKAVEDDLKGSAAQREMAAHELVYASLSGTPEQFLKSYNDVDAVLTPQQHVEMMRRWANRDKETPDNWTRVDDLVNKVVDSWGTENKFAVRRELSDARFGDVRTEKEDPFSQIADLLGRNGSAKPEISKDTYNFLQALVTANIPETSRPAMRDGLGVIHRSYTPSDGKWSDADGKAMLRADAELARWMESQKDSRTLPDGPTVYAKATELATQFRPPKPVAAPVAVQPSWWDRTKSFVKSIEPTGTSPGPLPSDKKVAFEVDPQTPPEVTSMIKHGLEIGLSEDEVMNSDEVKPYLRKRP